MTDLLLDYAAALSLGLETADGLPAVAAACLAAGADSPSLRTLAAMEAPRLEDALPILQQALREAGQSLPTERAAALRLARRAARRMLNGEMAAYQGSKEIWTVARSVTNQSTADLDPFIYAASEWEERPADRRFFEDAMLLAARDLVSRSDEIA